MLNRHSSLLVPGVRSAKLPTAMFSLTRYNENQSSYYRMLMGKEQTLSSAAFFCPKEKVLGSKPASCKIRGRGFLFEEETEGRHINGEREKRGGTGLYTFTESSV